MRPLPSESAPTPPPVHVAIIMDGNGRWAKARGLPRAEGHRRGVEATRRAVRGAIDLGIANLTLYGFSSENWKRPVREIDDLMHLLRFYLRKEAAELRRNGVRVRIIGDRVRLAPDIVRLIEDVEDESVDNVRLNLVVAFSYGSRGEITETARVLARMAVEGGLAPDDIDEQLFANHLATAGTPDPDIIIRTSGEQRLSNFLLWQSAYAELIFTNTLWPDFTKDDLAEAIEEFHRRERRYGAASA